MTTSEHKGSHIRLLTLVGAGLAVGVASETVLIRYGHRKPMTIGYEVASQKPPMYFTYFYRSDGTHVEAYNYRLGVGSPPITRIIEIPAQRTRSTVDVALKVTSSSVVPASVVAGGLRTPSRFSNRWSCKTEVAALVPGAADIECERSDADYLGYPVWKVRATLGQPPKQMVTELLLAPTLDWHFLQRTVRLANSGTAQSVVKAVKITEGQPDPSLFEIPRDAKVVSRKELSRILK